MKPNVNTLVTEAAVTSVVVAFGAHESTERVVAIAIGLGADSVRLARILNVTAEEIARMKTEGDAVCRWVSKSIKQKADPVCLARNLNVSTEEIAKMKAEGDAICEAEEKAMREAAGDVAGTDDRGGRRIGEIAEAG